LSVLEWRNSRSANDFFKKGKIILMKDFERVLYEALLVSYGKILAKYNAFAQGSILRDVGKEIIKYLNSKDFGFEEKGNLEDLSTLTEMFVKNGFAENLDIETMDEGEDYTWQNLYGMDAYKELYEISDNPFLACPLNLCLFYLSEKNKKTLLLHKKSFDMEKKVTSCRYELVDRSMSREEAFDPLVIENARLYELAEERAARLEKAYEEIKNLRGIIPICASCKKIRDDEGYWEQTEVYMQKRTGVDFSHSLCPECFETAMLELLDENGDTTVEKNLELNLKLNNRQKKEE